MTYTINRDRNEIVVYVGDLYAWGKYDTVDYSIEYVTRNDQTGKLSLQKVTTNNSTDADCIYEDLVWAKEWGRAV